MDTIAQFLSEMTPSKIIELPQGEYLFHQKDPTSGIFVIKHGTVKLIRDSVDGNKVIIHIAQTNDSLAEASLFSDHYHCHARAEVASQIFRYSKQNILACLEKDSTLSLNFIETLAKQVQRLRLLIELRSIRAPRERLMQYLNLMVDLKRSLQIETTYKDLAVTLGMTHETLYRILSQLEKERLIVREDKTISLSI